MSRRRLSEQAGRARAQGGRRFDVLVVLAVLLPALVAVSTVWLRGHDTTLTAVAPTSSRLTQVSMVCPSPVSRPAGDVQVTRVPGVDGGEVGARVATPQGELSAVGPVAAGEELTAVPDSGSAVVLTGSDAAAPGLVAGRTDPAAIAECREPWYDDWFVGLGAAAKQSSVIELVNPDNATAVVDIEIFDRSGPVHDADWRGVTVPGHDTVEIDLSEHPVRSVVAAHVTVSRGRVAATARHTYDALGQSQVTTDYVPAQTEPATENLLLGIPANGQQRSLVVANPGDDEVRVSVGVVTESSTFRTTGTEEVALPPGAVRQVPLARLLTSDAAAGVLGLQVTATGPVVAGARALVDGDLTMSGPVRAYDQPMVAVVPTGPKRLVLGGAEGTGVVKVSALAANGRVIWDERAVEVAAARATPLELPPLAVRITVEAQNTPIAGTVVASGDVGTGTLRLVAARVSDDVPAVRPAG